MVHAAGPHLQVIRPCLHAAPCYYALACSCKSSFLRGTVNRTELKDSTKNIDLVWRTAAAVYILMIANRNFGPGRNFDALLRESE